MEGGYTGPEEVDYRRYNRPVEISSRWGVVTAKFATPSVGSAESPGIAEAIASAIDDAGKGLRYLVLDVSRVTFVNSMGLGMWINLRNRVLPLGGEVILLGLREELRLLMKTVKVDELFQVVPDQDGLRKALRGWRGGGGD